MTKSFPVLPTHSSGQRIGLFGGSFNPPHEGHRHVSLIAFKRLQLDQIWWLVTPGNPLKDNSALPPLAKRMEAARSLARHPRIKVTGFEAEINTRFTCDTIAYLKRRCSQVDFVWLMGGDNLSGFHRWYRWHDIAELVPIAVIDRPGATLKSVHAKAALRLAGRRIAESNASMLAGAKCPAWVFLHGPRSHLSSTMLRNGSQK